MRKRGLTFIVGDDRESKILQVEYRREKWRLRSVRYRLEGLFRVHWVHVLRTRMQRKHCPAITIGGYTDPIPKEVFRGSGQCLLWLDGWMEQWVVGAYIRCISCREQVNPGAAVFDYRGWQCRACTLDNDYWP